MEYISYNKDSLKKFIESGEYKTFSFLPVSLHRAISHINNPRADKDDILLIIAKENNQLAGYLGLLTDQIFQDGNSIKVAWLSTLYVDTAFRGKKIANKLLNLANEFYNDSILITEFTPEAERLYQRSNYFNYLEPLEGERYYFRSDLANTLPRKNSRYVKLTPLLKGIDKLVNCFVNLKPQHKINFTDFEYHITSSLTTEDCNFIEKEEETFFNRKSKELLWIISYPWVLKESKKLDNYLFSATSKEFKTEILRITSNNKIISLLIYTIRDGIMKIGYVFGNNKEAIANCLPVIVKRNLIKTLISYDKELNTIINHKETLSIIYQKKSLRKFLIHKNLQKKIYDYKGISGGDGDCIFT